MPMTGEQFRSALKAGFDEVLKEILTRSDAKTEAGERRMEGLEDYEGPRYVVKGGVVRLDRYSPPPRAMALEPPRTYRDPITGFIKRG